MFAVMLGMLVATTVALGFEFLGKMQFPVPAGQLPAGSDPAALIAIAPTGMLLLIVIGWLAAALCGGWVAARISRRHPREAALAVGVLILLSVLLNAWMLPYPAWITVVNALGAVPLAWSGSRLARRVPKRAA